MADWTFRVFILLLIVIAIPWCPCPAQTVVSDTTHQTLTQAQVDSLASSYLYKLDTLQLQLKIEAKSFAQRAANLTGKSNFANFAKITFQIGGTVIAMTTDLSPKKKPWVLGLSNGLPLFFDYIENWRKQKGVKADVYRPLSVEARWLSDSLWVEGLRIRDLREIRGHANVASLDSLRALYMAGRRRQVGIEKQVDPFYWRMNEKKKQLELIWCPFQLKTYFNPVE